MMMCLKDLLLYVVLLPIPSTSPLLIGLYWLAVILSIRPCGYCIALFIVIYLTTSSSSPFLSISSPQLPINPLKPLTSPLPDRSWLTWNNGTWWEPAIVGYSEIASVYQNAVDNFDLSNTRDAVESGGTSNDGKDAASASEQSGSWWSRRSWRQSAVTPKPIETPSPSPSRAINPLEVRRGEPTQLPPNYFDFSWAGVGFILDVGFSRSEEGMGWELADAKRAVGVRSEQETVRLSGDESKGSDHVAPKEDKASDDPQKSIPWVTWIGAGLLSSW